jgi:hypothetical protein
VGAEDGGTIAGSAGGMNNDYFPSFLDGVPYVGAARDGLVLNPILINQI